MAEHLHAVTLTSMKSDITVAELAAILFHKPSSPLKTIPESVYSALPANVQRHYVQLGPNVS